MSDGLEGFRDMFAIIGVAHIFVVFIDFLGRWNGKKKRHKGRT